MTKDRLLDEFILCIQEKRNVDWANAGSVRKYNRLSMKRIRIAKLINGKYREIIPDFTALLQHPDWDIKLACAISLLEIISCEKQDRECAIAVIREYINSHDTADAMGWRMKLEDLGYSENKNIEQ